MPTWLLVLSSAHFGQARSWSTPCHLFSTQLLRNWLSWFLLLEVMSVTGCSLWWWDLSSQIRLNFSFLNVFLLWTSMLLTYFGVKRLFYHFLLALSSSRETTVLSTLYTRLPVTYHATSPWQLLLFLKMSLMMLRLEIWRWRVILKYVYLILKSLRLRIRHGRSCSPCARFSLTMSRT